MSGHPSRAGHAYSKEDWSPEAACLSDFAVINSAFVQGPVASYLPILLARRWILLKGFLTGDIVPGSFDINICMVDVPDVARAHIVAMEKSVGV